MSPSVSPARESNVEGDVPPPQIHFDPSHARDIAIAWAGLRQFYSHSLAQICAAISGVSAGVLLTRNDEGAFQSAALWPDDATKVHHLRAAIERVAMDGRAVVAQHTADAGIQPAAARVQIAYPIASGSKLVGILAVELSSAKEGAWQAAINIIRQRLSPSAQHPASDLAQDPAREIPAALVLDALEIFSEHDGFEASATLLANTLAARLGCSRVSIGLPRARGIALKAMSDSAAFDRKSDLVVQLQGVMEEAFDQRATVSSLASTERRIAVAHAEFAARSQTGAVLSVLIKSSGRRVGVLTLEWRDCKSVDALVLRTCEFLADHIGPLVELKYKQQQLISGRIARWVRGSTAKLFGPDRPSLKLGVALVTFSLLLLTFWPADFRVAAKVVLEGSMQRAAVAPFDGFVSEAPLRAGDIVQAGQTLARLDDRDLKLEKLKWETERQKLVHKQREAFAKHDRPNILATSAQIEQAESQLKLTLEKLRRTEIASPIDGVIVTGDLSQMLGAPVTQGKVLFEIAPLNSYRLLLQVDERDIGHVRVGQTGTLLLTGAPARGLQLTVTKLTSVATAEDARNFFRVEASLTESGAPLRPGMEGLAKIDAGRRSLLWIWTRPMIERLRMLVWTWTP